MTISSSAMRSSTSREDASPTISLRRSSPYFLSMAVSSSEMISMRCSLLPRIARSSSMVARTSMSSSSSFSISRPVSLASLISRMALAWRSESSKDSCRRVEAVSASRDPRMTLMTSSMLSTAILRPSRMCSRSSARARSKAVRRTTTVWRWSMKWRSISRRDSTRGTPFTRARRMVPKVDCIWVCLYSPFRTICGMASLLSSMTIRRPSRSDSSLRSRMSVSFLSRTS